MTGRCGSEVGYQDHLVNGSPKCAPCRRAHADKRADYRRRRYLNHAPLSVDAAGTRRRIQALAAIGWSLAEQSRRLGWPASMSNKLTRRSWVWVSTAEKVAALFDELSMIPGPNVRARNDARRKGWPPPLAWDDIDDPDATPATAVDSDDVDELAVDAVLEGHRLALTGATAHAAVHALHARNVPAAVIAERIDIDERQVWRLKARDTAPHRKTNNYLGETA